MGKIGVHGIKLYAFHGCTDEEQKIGTNYEVDVVIELDLSKPSISDNLNETVDYVIIYDIVREEMSIKSRLIEHVAKRISYALMQQIPEIQKIKVTVAKLHPPVNGIVNRVFTELEETR
jgi:dihydroneopterin aldolase